MTDILVIGGGFAGVWAAAGAARLLRSAGAERSVTLVAPGDDLVMRPRLYEARPQAMSVPLDRVLGPVGVRRVKGTATAIDTGSGDTRRITVTAADGSRSVLPYGQLVLAAGSRLERPRLPGGGHLHDVDTMDAAVALDTHLRALPGGAPGPGRFTAVVVGAGFTGLEVATELVERLRAAAEPHGAAGEVRVVLVDRGDAIGLGPGPRPVIAAALAEVGVETRLGVTLRRVDAHAAELSDGTVLPARTVVWTVGVRASPLTALLPAPASRDRMGRLMVDPFLEVTGVPGVYAAGDTAAADAEPGHQVLPSCQHAIPLGKLAGHNAAAALLGLPPAPFAPKPYVTCLDLGGAGAVFTTGWERTVQLTGPEAKALKRRITEQWIYPPLDDAEEILREADHRRDIGETGREAVTARTAAH